MILCNLMVENFLEIKNFGEYYKQKIHGMHCVYAYRTIIIYKYVIHIGAVLFLDITDICCIQNIDINRAQTVVLLIFL